ncbi:nodulin-related protein 1-like [Abrus precatorius]|uniref:Nodulin-related protein 1-like n=1 Tax=Abrus precatorius TaxID=3816 RepID=A0A8B8KR27_ABRPR|nr:nodulin-related protein 1-like [Abrus precatorius]
MASEESQNKPSGHSSSELLASAKLVADAAQSTMKNESDKVDKAKVADAAGDLLDAAGQYGKFDDKKGVGQYLDKAADYLHQYQNTSGTPPPSKPQESKGDDAKPDEGSGAAGGGGGFGGDFAKLAGGVKAKIG